MQHSWCGYSMSLAPILFLPLNGLGDKKCSEEQELPQEFTMRTLSRILQDSSHQPQLPIQALHQLRTLGVREPPRLPAHNLLGPHRRELDLVLQLILELTKLPRLQPQAHPRGVQALGQLNLIFKLPRILVALVLMAKFSKPTMVCLPCLILSTNLEMNNWFLEATYHKIACHCHVGDNTLATIQGISSFAECMTKCSETVCFSLVTNLAADRNAAVISKFIPAYLAYCSTFLKQFNFITLDT